jgi:predicted transcriptional regulator
VAVRFNIVLSDDLYKAINLAADETESTKGEILRKALQLYLTARDGSKRNLKFGLIDPKTEKLEIEIIGL